MKQTLQIVGIGPGNPDYILPAAKKVIEQAQVIAAGRRNFKSLEEAGLFSDQERILIGDGISLKETLNYLKEAVKQNKKAVVAVSGDSGFYSILAYLKKNLPEITIEAIPGISSISYLYAKLSRGYETVKLMSLHGREQDLARALETGEEIAVLTDKENTPLKIAEFLDEHKIRRSLIVGENLSYPDERIFTTGLDGLRALGDLGSNVVIIAGEK